MDLRRNSGGEGGLYEEDLRRRNRGGGGLMSRIEGGVEVDDNFRRRRIGGCKGEGGLEEDLRRI